MTTPTPTPIWKPSAGDECQNSEPRRQAEGFFEKYITNRSVLDIGCGNHKISLDARGWDIAQGDGDAARLDGIEKESYATVFSSHLLEHMNDPMAAMLRWWEVVKVGGYMIIAVPDEDLYEQGYWPSMFNPDHRSTWTLHKSVSWSPESKNIMDMVKNLPAHKLVSARICDNRYDYSIKNQDQGLAERQVEVIIQKVPEPEPWVDSISIRPQCICGKPGTLRLLGIYSNGKVLVQCGHCGQKLTWEMVKALKQMGLIQEVGNG